MLLAAAATANASIPVGGNGTKENPYLMPLPRPEQDDLLHNPNGSPCTGGMGVEFYQSGNGWDPRFNNGLTCQSVFPSGGTRAPSAVGSSNFWHANNQSFADDNCGPGATCGMYKFAYKVLGPLHPFRHGVGFTLTVPPIYQHVNGQWYSWVWTGPTTFCASPASVYVQTVQCRFTELVITAGKTFTRFG